MSDRLSDGISNAVSDAATPPGAARAAPARAGLWRFARRNPTICLGGGIIATMVLLALGAPLFAGDPLVMIPVHRLQPPSAEYWFGTDNLGRDVFARTVYGARASLLVGLSVAVVSVAGGLIIGLAAGYYRRFDSVVMRLMDGLMAIP
ncbi:MAG TPA: hypothetical protein VFE41_01520 [Acetobacteraceae bacterium]|nr:hypothetical protein [Acetobacteraceae bacterium]